MYALLRKVYVAAIQVLGNTCFLIQLINVQVAIVVSVVDILELVALISGSFSK